MAGKAAGKAARQGILALKIGVGAENVKLFLSEP